MLLFEAFLCVFDNIWFLTIFIYRNKKLQINNLLVFLYILQFTLSYELCKLYELVSFVGYMSYVNYMFYVSYKSYLSYVKLYEYFINHLKSLEIN